MTDNKLLKPQPEPQQLELPFPHMPVWKMVIKDMEDRDGQGRVKYGMSLRPFNGRDALIDAYQEALDLAVYLRQVIYERDFYNK